VIIRAVGSCDVLLALIGNEWLTITDAHGRRRLDNSDDFVRLEIEAALSRGVRVIPVLVNEARMPRAEELPDSLAALVRRQALELSPARFDFDTSRLLKVLDRVLADVQAAQQDPAPMPTPGAVPDLSPTALPEALVPGSPASDPAAPDGQQQSPPVQQAAQLATSAGGGSTSSADSPPTTVPGRPAPQTRRRRMIYAAGAIVVVAAAGTTVGLLTLNTAHSPPQSGQASGNTFIERSPWRLVTEGWCNVTVTNTGAGKKKVIPVAAQESVQMQDTGTLRWAVDNSPCLVAHRPGPGNAVLPFTWQADQGDTDAFHASGRFAVTVKNFDPGENTCDLVLRDAKDGQQVDFGTAHRGGGPVLLDPNGRSQVYLSDLRCTVEVSSG
jgi:hypothetical protein